MLRNAQNQIIVLNAAQRNICSKGMEDVAHGYETPDRMIRQRLLAPLRETKELSDPCGRGTSGMFSISERAKFVQ